MEYTKPLPIITSTNAPYWEAARRHELRFQKCRSCGNWIYPISPICPACWSEEYDWVVASERGRVTSWVVYHRAFEASFQDDVPYAVIQVELEEGMRLVSNPVGVAPEAIYYGMPVEVAFDDVTPEVTLVKFRPAGG